MANDYYVHGSYPATGAPGMSAPARSEFDLITAGFDKLPVLTGNGLRPVVVNAGGAGMTVTVGTLALAGNFATTGVFNLTLAVGATVTLTTPLLSGTLATLAGTETFTNKTLTTPIIAQILTNAGAATLTLPAATDTLVGRATTDTLTNKTLTAPVIATIVNGAATLTLPTSTDTIVGRATTAILTNKTLTAPAINGAATSTTGSTLTVGSNVLIGSVTDKLNAAHLAIASQAVGDLLYADTPTSFTRLPIAALSYNPIINHAMEIWQRGTSFAAAANGAYTADRWTWGFGGTGVVTISRSSNVPTVAQAGVLFNYSLDVDVTTADAALAAGDVYVVQHKIEGYNWRHFAQRQFTVSFWARDTITGEHAVSFQNLVPDRSYIATYTINVADTWEYKTVTVSASPSAGTWNYSNGVGLIIAFTMAAGSGYQTTAGAWQTGIFYGTSTTVNSMSSALNAFAVTGVKLELGSVATPLQFRSVQDELALCQRYYEKTFDQAIAPAQNTGIYQGVLTTRVNSTGALIGSVSWRFATPKRGVPTLVTYNPNAANANWRRSDNLGDETVAPSHLSETGAVINTSTAGSQGPVYIQAAADAEL